MQKNIFQNYILFFKTFITSRSSGYAGFQLNQIILFIRIIIQLSVIIFVTTNKIKLTSDVKILLLNVSLKFFKQMGLNVEKFGVQVVVT